MLLDPPYYEKVASQFHYTFNQERKIKNPFILYQGMNNPSGKGRRKALVWMGKTRTPLVLD
jgi:hypothetical protein